MSSTSITLGLCLVAIWLSPLAGRRGDEIETVQEYRERMLEIDHSFSSLRGQPNVYTSPDVEEEAVALIELFGEVERFWKGRGDEEKAGFARMAKEGAEAVREAAIKKEQKAFEAAVETIAASCEGCHREPLDKYRFRTTPH